MCINTRCDCTHLYQGFLHGGPIGNPPGALQHEVRVRVALRLAVFRQRLPLVQFLRTAGEERTGEELGNFIQRVLFKRATDVN